MSIFYILLLEKNDVLLIQQWYLKTGDWYAVIFLAGFGLSSLHQGKSFLCALKLWKTVFQLHLSSNIVYYSPFFFGMLISSTSLDGSREVCTGLLKKLQKIVLNYKRTEDTRSPVHFFVLLTLHSKMCMGKTNRTCLFLCTPAHPCVNITGYIVCGCLLCHLMLTVSEDGEEWHRGNGP